MKLRRSPLGRFQGAARSRRLAAAGRQPGDETHERYAILLQGLSDLGEGVNVGIGERFVYVNDAFCQISGYSRDELLALDSAVALAAPEKIDQSRQRLAQLSSGIELGRFQGALRHKDGHIVDLDIATRVVQEHGHPIHLSVIRDISERRHSEQALAQANALVQLLQSIAIACNEASSFDAALTDTLRDVCTYTGWPIGHVYLVNEAGELESTQLWHVDQPERYTAFRDLSDRRRLAPGAGVFGHVFTSGQPTWIADLAREHDFVRKAAAEACGIVSAFALPILLSGQVVGVLEFFTTTRSEPDQALLDLLTRIGRQLGRVVERQRAAEQLAASEQRFRSLATFAPVGILQADRQGNCIFVNQRWQELAGLSQGEARGSGWARALHPDDRERVVEAWYAAAQHGQPFAMEYRYQRPDGSISWIFGTATALHTSRGEPEGYLGSLTDISERVHEQESLRQLTTRLAQSNRELQEFAYIASHDLQEPLRKIRTFGDRLNTKYASALGTDGAGYVLRMQSAAARLQDLINDLLTFARIDAKREPFQRVDLNQIASEVVSNLEARISETGGQVTFGQLPQIEANSVQIYQLFQNLIGNALKFARDNVAPHVAISARLLPAAKPNQPSMYELTVADNGIGFDEKYLDRIFTPFQRLHERGKYEGTGMGLAICRRIVEQHHGSITATSIRNQGSTFIIHLPAAQQKEEKGK